MLSSSACHCGHDYNISADIMKWCCSGSIAANMCVVYLSEFQHNPRESWWQESHLGTTQRVVAFGCILWLGLRSQSRLRWGLVNKAGALLWGARSMVPLMVNWMRMRAWSTVRWLWDWGDGKVWVLDRDTSWGLIVLLVVFCIVCRRES